MRGKNGLDFRAFRPATLVLWLRVTMIGCVLCNTALYITTSCELRCGILHLAIIMIGFHYGWNQQEAAAGRGMGTAMTDHFENGDSFETPARTRQARVGRGRCQVCVHPERIRIEALHVGGVTLDALQAEFGIQRDAIHRHCKMHVTKIAKINYLAGPVQIATLAQAAARENKSILEYLCVIRSILMNQLVKCAEGARRSRRGRFPGI
jgi:hypothetical protein